MSNSLQSKLKKYSILAGSAIAATTTKADIVYTDINDVTFSNNGQFYDLDLNNDGTPDFKLDITKINNIISSYYYSSYSFYIVGVKYNAVALQPLNTNEAVVSGGLYIDVLNQNTPINQAANWNANQNNLGYFLSYYYSNYWSNSNSATSNGPWNNTQNKYIGLKLKVSGNTYYGWVRLDVANLYDNFTVKDYAFQDAPNIPIKAGDQGNINADIAINVNGIDVANNGDASDMQVSFTKATDETKVSSYRLMIVKASQAGTFGINDAKNVLPVSYMVHTPNGSNFQANLASNFTDTDGDPIVQNIAYKVFVLSVPDGINATAYQLSSQQNTVTLTITQGTDETEHLELHIYSSGKTIFIDNSGYEFNGKYADIINIQGQIVETIQLQQGLNSNNSPQLSNGIYCIKVRGTNVQATKVFLNE